MLTNPFHSVLEAPARRADPVRDAAEPQSGRSFENVFAPPSSPDPARARPGQNDADSPASGDDSGETSVDCAAIDPSHDCAPPIDTQERMHPPHSPEMGVAPGAAGPPADQAGELATLSGRSQTAAGPQMSTISRDRSVGNGLPADASGGAGTKPGSAAIATPQPDGRVANNPLSGPSVPGGPTPTGANAPGQDAAGGRGEMQARVEGGSNETGATTRPAMAGPPGAPGQGAVNLSTVHPIPEARDATRNPSGKMAAGSPFEPDATESPEERMWSEAGGAAVSSGSLSAPPHHAAGQRLTLTPGGMRGMAEALVRQSDGRIEIALSPEELGRVRMALVTSETGVSVSIGADRPETLALMRRHIEQLASDLRQLGYTDVGFSFSGGSDPRARHHPRYAEPDLSPEAAPELWSRFQPADAARTVKPGRIGLDLRL